MRQGARYNRPGVVTVYLADDIETCLAERAFYFQREYLQFLEYLSKQYPGATGFPPPYNKRAVLWRVVLQRPVADVADLGVASAGTFGVFPCMMTNPSQDYVHLAERRTHAQANGYLGIRAPSSRSKNGGHMAVLFQDQSTNVASIEAAEVEMQLVQPGTGRRLPSPFVNHQHEILDFEAISFRVVGPSPVPAWAKAYTAWTVARFNH
jgi:hypothetical protein